MSTPSQPVLRWSVVKWKLTTVIIGQFTHHRVFVEPLDALERQASQFLANQEAAE